MNAPKIERRVDDFTDEVTIELKNTDPVIILDGDPMIEMPLVWETKFGFYLLLSSLSNRWLFKNAVDKNDLRLYVIADNDKFTIKNGINVKEFIGNGHYELYSWILTEDIIEKLIEANTLRIRFCAIELPELTKETKRAWRAIYKAGKKEEAKAKK